MGIKTSMNCFDAKIYTYLCVLTFAAVWQASLAMSQCRQICSTSWEEWSNCNASSSIRVRLRSACCPQYQNITACIIFCNFTDNDKQEEELCDPGKI
jgi:hypothetical protein